MIPVQISERRTSLSATKSSLRANTAPVSVSSKWCSPGPSVVAHRSSSATALSIRAS